MYNNKHEKSLHKDFNSSPAQEFFICIPTKKT